MAADEPKRRDMGARAARWAKQEFTAERYADAVEALAQATIDAEPVLHLAAHLGGELVVIGCGLAGVELRQQDMHATGSSSLGGVPDIEVNRMTLRLALRAARRTSWRHDPHRATRRAVRQYCTWRGAFRFVGRVGCDYIFPASDSISNVLSWRIIPRQYGRLEWRI